MVAQEYRAMDFKNDSNGYISASEARQKIIDSNETLGTNRNLPQRQPCQQVHPVMIVSDKIGCIELPVLHNGLVGVA